MRLQFRQKGRVTEAMNPTVPRSVIDRAYERDPANAAAEYGAEFRSDLEAFVSRDVIDSATAPHRHELPPATGEMYSAFVDPSGGSSDSMTLAIAHRDRATNRTVLDAVRERRPPFSPEDVVREFGAVRVVVDAASAELLSGSTLDYSDGLQGAGFHVTNPNATRTCGCGSSFS